MSSTLSSPAHRAAIAFLRGGLLAIVTLLAAPRAAGWAAAIPGLEGFGTWIVAALPAAGFAGAWAFGGAALGRGRAGVLAFALGGVVSGLLLSLVWPQLAGLTGREPLAPLLAFSVLTWAGAFGIGGGIAGWRLDTHAAVALAWRFAIGGALGALVFVAPSLAWPLGADAWPAAARLALTTLSSVAGLLAPFAVGGAAAGRLVGRDG